jgi:predicted RNase H-like nuclease (RuvC/YqgF family)
MVPKLKKELQRFLTAPAPPSLTYPPKKKKTKRQIREEFRKQAYYITESQKRTMGDSFAELGRLNTQRERLTKGLDAINKEIETLEEKFPPKKKEIISRKVIENPRFRELQCTRDRFLIRKEEVTKEIEEKCKVIYSILKAKKLQFLKF